MADLEPFFTPSSRGLVPSPYAVGPWSAQMLHGRLLAGLAAWAIEERHGDPGFVPVRLTVDMYRNPAMEPAEVTTTVVRSGGRVRAFDALVRVGGVDVARASSLHLRAGDAPDEDAPRTPAWDAPTPDLGAVEPDANFDVVSVDGPFGAPGRRRLWERDRRCLVDGVALTPFVRAALVADIASPLANFGSAGLDYINADLTLHLGRLPEGEWIGVEPSTRTAAAGVSVAACTLFDAAGAIGASSVCAVRNARMAPAG